MFLLSNRGNCYTLTKHLNEGLSSVLWLADCRSHLATTELAVKVLKDISSNKAIIEKTKISLQTLEHQHILPIIEADIYSNKAFIVSEYVADGSLKNWLERNNGKAPSLESAIDMILGIVDGLTYLHSKKILHYNLKLSNILLQSKIPKLTDFGICYSINTSVAEIAYRSPESLEGIFSESSDLWAVGVILYELLIGKLPNGNFTKEIALLPQKLQETILAALQKDPSRRVKSAKEIKEILEGKTSSTHVFEENYPVIEFESVKLNSKGEVTNRYTALASILVEELGNGVNLEMVEVPSGSFLMGSDPSLNDEWPQRQVKISQFYIGRFQITQSQWEAVMQSNPSYFKGKDLPVEKISWKDAVEFCSKLSLKTKRNYRLPSEAEWEYACRAGTNSPFSFGDTITTEFVNYDGKFPYANAPEGKNRQKTIEVGQLGTPNHFGIFDMHGNVWEWCQDIYHPNYQTVPTDGSARNVTSGFGTRVLRGGSWFDNALYCRSAIRNKSHPDTKNSTFGLRVVMNRK